MRKREVFYFASKYEKRAELISIANTIKRLGYTVDANWLGGTHEGDIEKKREWAREDLRDIQNCTHFVLFNLPVDNPAHSSGRFIELGYALALRKQCTSIGQSTSVFNSLITTYLTVEQFIDYWTAQASKPINLA